MSHSLDLIKTQALSPQTGSWQQQKAFDDDSDRIIFGFDASWVFSGEKILMKKFPSGRGKKHVIDIIDDDDYGARKSEKLMEASSPVGI